MLHCSVIGLCFQNPNFHWQRVKHNEAEYITNRSLPLLVPTEPNSISCEQEEHHNDYLQKQCFFNVSYTQRWCTFTCCLGGLKWKFHMKWWVMGCVDYNLSFYTFSSSGWFKGFTYMRTLMGTKCSICKVKALFSFMQLYHLQWSTC